MMQTDFLFILKAFELFSATGLSTTRRVISAMRGNVVIYIYILNPVSHRSCWH